MGTEPNVNNLIQGFEQRGGYHQPTPPNLEAMLARLSGEQQAIADLFACAIGAYKNSASHRTIRFDDAVEAAVVIRLADLLLRIAHRATG
ncbi:TIGR02391 family protein [Microbacterium forte]|uniref:TIGR02391 family protein n=1 Tax=Microbacterium forte TaxID=2982533 RepID=UPI002893374A|nr:TIGR02391 family protein [Microbacterium sp. A(2022)]